MKNGWLPENLIPSGHMVTIARIHDGKILDIFLDRDEAETKYPESTSVELQPAVVFTEIRRKQETHIIIPGGNGSSIDNNEKVKNMSTRLQLHLKENKLSQKNFERDSGVSMVTIGKYLRGEIKNPRAKIIEAFAQALNMTPIQLTSLPKVH